MPQIPLSELQITYARSSGPGGQNVNKRETKAVVRWNIPASPSVTEQEKTTLFRKLANRITQDGDVIVDAESERSQAQNRANAVQLLQAMVDDALRPEIKRVPTKPTRASRRKRLDTKKKQSRKKQQRRSPGGEE